MTRYNSVGNALDYCAETWLLGGQNGDFFLSKFNNQLVNHRATRKSSFFLHSKNVYGFCRIVFSG